MRNLHYMQGDRLQCNVWYIAFMDHVKVGCMRASGSGIIKKCVYSERAMLDKSGAVPSFAAVGKKYFSFRNLLD